MSYLALARKYRPQTFDELIGQEFVTTSLKNAIDLKRVSHAYLFTGARGVGKTSAARIMAKALNCLSPVDSNPCNKCEHCLEITEGTSIDVVEIDGASNRGIDEIRQLREAVKFIPVKYKYKVYIIDEVHMLTEAASNALLKTLEEPPSYVVFIFATTDAHKIMPTILSRCQKYDFKKIPFDDMQKALEAIYKQEKVAYDLNALSLVIRHSEGCFRDALSFSDQIISYSSGNLTYDIVAGMLGIREDSVINDLFSAILKEDRSVIEELIHKLCDSGVSLIYANERMIQHTRNLLFLKNEAVHIRKELTSDESDFYNNLLSIVSEERLFALFQLLQKLYGDLKYSSFMRYTFEFGMYKAASISRIIPLPAGEVVPAFEQVSKPKQHNNIQSAARSNSKAEANAKTPAQQTTELSQIDKKWHEILEELKAGTPAIAAVLSHATLTNYDLSGVEIIFPVERVFQFNRATQPESLKMLKAFFSNKLGANVAVNIKSTNDEKKKPLIDKKNELESLYERQLKEESAEKPAMKLLFELFEASPSDLKIIKDNE